MSRWNRGIDLEEPSESRGMSRWDDEVPDDDGLAERSAGLLWNRGGSVFNRRCGWRTAKFYSLDKISLY